MIIVAGPPGSGKSTAFPVSQMGVENFNADDRAAVLNGGSYQNISPEIRAQVAKELEQFITNHIREGTSFAFETTLRTDITLKQSQQARKNGFRVLMRYICLDDVNECINRVAIRADHGGHSAPPDIIKETYSASVTNLLKGIQEFDEIFVYDNSQLDEPCQLILEILNGEVRYISRNRPNWLNHTVL